MQRICSPARTAWFAQKHTKSKVAYLLLRLVRKKTTGMRAQKKTTSCLLAGGRSVCQDLALWQSLAPVRAPGLCICGGRVRKSGLGSSRTVLSLLTLTS